jgi:hypothetical protein
MIMTIETPVEKWLKEHPDASSDYSALIERLKSGECVECIFGKDIGTVEYVQVDGIILFVIETSRNIESCSSQEEFITLCNKLDLMFDKGDNK